MSKSSLYLVSFLLLAFPLLSMGESTSISKLVKKKFSCKKFKERYLSTENKDAIYSNYPLYNKFTPHKIIKFDNLSIPIPMQIHDYKDAEKKYRNKSKHLYREYSLGLSRITISASILNKYYIKNIVRYVGLPKILDPVLTSDGRNLTKLLFNNRVTRYDLFHAVYTAKEKPLSCNENTLSMLRKIYHLGYKFNLLAETEFKLRSGAKVKILHYKLRNSKHGLITKTHLKSKKHDFIHYVILIQRPSNTSQWILVSYLFENFIDNTLYLKYKHLPFLLKE